MSLFCLYKPLPGRISTQSEQTNHDISLFNKTLQTHMHIFFFFFMSWHTVVRGLAPPDRRRRCPVGWRPAADRRASRETPAARQTTCAWQIRNNTYVDTEEEEEEEKKEEKKKKKKQVSDWASEERKKHLSIEKKERDSYRRMSFERDDWRWFTIIGTNLLECVFC